MDELEIKGQKYISSKRAAEISGYAKDYIGQLARAGKIAATRFGRAWYVEESALLAHFKAETKGSSEPKIVEPQTLPKSVLSPNLYKPYSFPKTWGDVRYFADNTELLPTLSKTSSSEPAEIPNKNMISWASLDRNTTESPVATEVRIKVLQDGLIPKNPITRLPEHKPVQKHVRTVEAPKAKKIAYTRAPSLLPMVVLAGSFLFFTLSISGLFFSSLTLYTPAHETYTASVLPSFEHIWDILKNSVFIQSGVSALSDFYTLLTGSFWAFLKSGLDFFKSF